MQALGYQQVKLKAMYNLMEASKQCREVSLKIHKILNLKIIINLMEPITNNNNFKIKFHSLHFFNHSHNRLKIINIINQLHNILNLITIIKIILTILIKSHKIINSIIIKTINSNHS